MENGKRDREDMEVNTTPPRKPRVLLAASGSVAAIKFRHTGHMGGICGMIAGAAAVYEAHHIAHSSHHPYGHAAYGHGFGHGYGYGHGKFKHGKHGKFKHGKHRMFGGILLFIPRETTLIT